MKCELTVLSSVTGRPWAFEVEGTAEHVRAWRAAGFTVGVLVGTVPRWVPWWTVRWFDRFFNR